MSVSTSGPTSAGAPLDRPELTVDDVRGKLIDLIAKFGRELSRDARRCKALLNDICRDRFRAEIFVLIGAIEEGVAAELSAASKDTPQDALLARLSQRLRVNRGVSPELAVWSVESWAIAFGILASGQNLATIKLREMCSLIDLAGIDGVIDAAEFERLLEKAVNRGVKIDVARNYLIAYATARNWAVNTDAVKVKFTDQGSAQIGQAQNALRFLGCDFQDATALAEAFAANWADASDFCLRQNQQLIDWLKHGLGLKQVADELASASGHAGLNADARLLWAIQILDPKRAPEFHGFALTQQSLYDLAKQTTHEGKARDLLRAIYHIGLDSVPPGIAGLAPLPSIGKLWANTIAEYDRLCRELRDVASTWLHRDDEQTTLLLAAVLPGNQIIGELRRRAINAISTDAGECPWFAELGSVANASPAALLVMPLVAQAATERVRTTRVEANRQRMLQQAEVGRRTREARYEVARNAYGNAAGLSVGLAFGLVGGAVPSWVVSAVIGWVWEQTPGGYGSIYF